MQQTKILVVDDNIELRTLVTTYLRREGFATEEAATGAMALQRFEEPGIDLVILDVRLPDADGFDLLRSLRERGSTPVIMLTGNDTPLDRVVGLELGADDYLGKPFELRELKARIRSVLRRTHQIAGVDAAAAVEVLAFAGFTLDLTHRRLIDAAGADVELTGGEFDLLRALAEHPRRPLARDHLLDLTRSRGWTPFDRSIDVLIGRLRRKLSVPDQPEIIKTVRNVGYMMAAEVTRRRVAPALLPGAAAGSSQGSAA